MTEPALPSVAETRRPQMFPVLTAAELRRIERFGARRRYRDGAFLAKAGEPSPGMCVVLSGKIVVLRHDGLGHISPIVEMGPGEFAAELAELSGHPAPVDVRAVGDVEALVVPADGVRALMVAEAELGERILRALILRRVYLIESKAAGPILVGALVLPDMIRLQGFLTRNSQPYSILDPETDPEALKMIERLSPDQTDYPLVVCPDGTVLRNPSEQELALCIGLLDETTVRQVYDVAIVGAGPGGLSTAVYAASEGLSVLVVDARAFGGQAGASARIENYLGFPTGISGQALAGRAYTQAQKFGARMLIPAEAVRLDCGRPEERDPLALELAGARSVRSRTVVVATGARYRRPDCSDLKTLEGRGVWYWASPIEAKMCAGQEVALVGGGNSAGQAAVFLAGHVAKVWMLVRGPGLAASMSRYLIDRIAAIPNIELRTRTEIVALEGSRESGVESLRWRHRDSGAEEARAIRNVFLFLGADPATEWLKDCGVAFDDKGFVTTGGGRLPLETSVPGVFAIGDVRAGSVKRVGGAIGEGAAVVAQIHAFLAPENAGVEARAA